MRLREFIKFFFRLELQKGRLALLDWDQQLDSVIDAGSEKVHPTGVLIREILCNSTKCFCLLLWSCWSEWKKRYAFLNGKICGTITLIIEHQSFGWWIQLKSWLNVFSIECVFNWMSFYTFPSYSTKDNAIATRKSSEYALNSIDKFWKNYWRLFDNI